MTPQMETAIAVCKTNHLPESHAPFFAGIDYNAPASLFFFQMLYRSALRQVLEAKAALVKFNRKPEPAFDLWSEEHSQYHADYQRHVMAYADAMSSLHAIRDELNEIIQEKAVAE